MLNYKKKYISTYYKMNSVKIANPLIHTKNHKVPQNDKVKLTSAGGVAVYADTSPTPTSDADDREGWLFTKVTEDTTKFNYYMYSRTASSHAWTIGDLKSCHLTCSIDNWTNGQSAPYVVVYTLPTGSGDQVPGFYHSRRSFALNTSNQKIIAGEHINLYAINKPNLHNDNRFIPLETTTDTGIVTDNDVINLISIHSDSSALIGTKILVSEMGYEISSDIKRNIKLVT